MVDVLVPIIASLSAPGQGHAYILRSFATGGGGDVLNRKSGRTKLPRQHGERADAHENGDA